MTSPARRDAPTDKKFRQDALDAIQSRVQRGLRERDPFARRPILQLAEEYLERASGRFGPAWRVQADRLVEPLRRAVPADRLAPAGQLPMTVGALRALLAGFPDSTPLRMVLGKTGTEDPEWCAAVAELLKNPPRVVQRVPEARADHPCRREYGVYLAGAGGPKGPGLVAECNIEDIF